VLGPEQKDVSYWSLLKHNRDFRRFFLAQAISSLGDWTGVIAIAVFAQRLGGTTAVGAVMTARVLPGFLVGPVAGVIADRFDRKRTMVIADVTRAMIIFTLPFVPNLAYLLVASVALESLTLVWGPAKDASLPNFVPMEHLQHANSLSLLAIYAPWPLASIVFAVLTTFGAYLATHATVMSGLTTSPEALALWVDSLTFAFSGLMISRLTIASSTRRGHLDFMQAKRDLFEGLKFVRDDRQVRPWLIGIALTFTAAGAVFSLGVEFVHSVLGGGERGFAFLIGFLATGMIIGLLAAGILAKRVQKDVLFSSSLLLLGAGLIALASMEDLTPAIPIASALGFFGGTAYSTGYSLMHETVTDEMRGRTFSAAYTVIRIGTLVGLGLFPFLASAVGDHTVELGFGTILLPGSRITLWLAGCVAIIGGVLSMRAIRARVSGRPRTHEGYFVVFEGGEGAGKTTQMTALAEWLAARGEDVITTREPGGTAIGSRIRDLVLDPESAAMDARTEALLYAADRAQHVAEVIKPALAAGKMVVSDRFVDSSLAYQGLARGLGLDEIYSISEWATGGLMPDLVFFLKIDPETAFARMTGDRDRIEKEAREFHRSVTAAYMQIAKRYPTRFVVLDATRPQAEIHEEVVAALQDRSSGKLTVLPVAATPPGVPR
jgi:dTMP kinase